MNTASMLNDAPWWAAVGVAALIAGTAWRLRHLRASGAIAACIVGALAFKASPAWALYLVAWFLIASLISSFGRTRKAQRVMSIIAKADARDAAQVLANGGLFAALALLTIAPIPAIPMDACLSVAAAAALAAAGADTFATEFGTLWRSDAISVRTWSQVPAGTSGAVTTIGTLATVVGATIFAVMAAAFGMIAREQIVAVAVGGLAGSIVDTILGAWLQERRWCHVCAVNTERRQHWCGAVTEHRHGVRHLNNDVVNALCTVTGAGVALLLAW